MLKKKSNAGLIFCENAVLKNKNISTSYMLGMYLHVAAALWNLYRQDIDKWLFELHNDDINLNDVTHYDEELQRFFIDLT